MQTQEREQVWEDWAAASRLTWEGVVTLISGTNVSSNRLRICSCLISLDGVCLGGGGTGGPFRSCGRAAGEGRAARGSKGNRDRHLVSHAPGHAPTPPRRQKKPESHRPSTDDGQR